MDSFTLALKIIEQNFVKSLEIYHELTHYAINWLTQTAVCHSILMITITKRSEIITIGAKKICDENFPIDSIVKTVFECSRKKFVIRSWSFGWHSCSLVTKPIQKIKLLSCSRMVPFLPRETQSKVLIHKYLISKINNQTRRFKTLMCSLKLLRTSTWSQLR